MKRFTRFHSLTLLLTLGPVLYVGHTSASAGPGISTSGLYAAGVRLTTRPTYSHLNSHQGAQLSRSSEQTFKALPARMIFATGHTVNRVYPAAVG